MASKLKTKYNEIFMQIRKDVVKIKLMGSKSRIAKYIVPIIQKCIDDNNLETYIESCVGGEYH